VAKAEREERFHFMAVGGMNQNPGHGANRLLALGRDEWVNRDDDQLGITRICVACRGQGGDMIGVLCITLVSAGLDAETERRCLAASRKTAAAIASFIPSLS
jgi:DNA-binding IclR family transcriptional regulator